MVQDLSRYLDHESLNAAAMWKETVPVTLHRLVFGNEMLDRRLRAFVVERDEVRFMAAFVAATIMDKGVCMLDDADLEPIRELAEAARQRNGGFVKPVPFSLRDPSRPWPVVRAAFYMAESGWFVHFCCESKDMVDVALQSLYSDPVFTFVDPEGRPLGHKEMPGVSYGLVQ